MESANPFTPSFGKIPPIMAGRDELLKDMSRAFEHGSGDPNLSTIFSGARGTGKTALMFYLSRIAGSQGWIAVNVSAVPGMLEDIYERAKKAAAHLVSEEPHARIKQVGIPQIINIEIDDAAPQAGNWRTRMTDLLDGLAAFDIGLLITVDEVKPELDEMVQLASVYQHFVGEDRKVALLMAGLPGKVSSLVSNDSISFLRRACRHRLGRISGADVSATLRATVEESGRVIDDDALDLAVAAIEGFPYMMQLVGFRMWAQHPAEEAITCADAEHGIQLAQTDFRERVLDATFYDLSNGDVRMLKAMLEDVRESQLVEIAARLGEKSNYVSTYKRRLLEQGIIGERGRSAVAFELPGFREYLAEQCD